MLKNHIYIISSKTQHCCTVSHIGPRPHQMLLFNWQTQYPNALSLPINIRSVNKYCGNHHVKSSTSNIHAYFTNLVNSMMFYLARKHACMMHTYM